MKNIKNKIRNQLKSLAMDKSPVELPEITKSFDTGRFQTVIHYSSKYVIRNT